MYVTSHSSLVLLKINTHLQYVYIISYRIEFVSTPYFLNPWSHSEKGSSDKASIFITNAIFSNCQNSYKTQGLKKKNIFTYNQNSFQSFSYF